VLTRTTGVPISRNARTTASVARSTTVLTIRIGDLRVIGGLLRYGRLCLAVTEKFDMLRCRYPRALVLDLCSLCIWILPQTRVWLGNKWRCKARQKWFARHVNIPFQLSSVDSSETKVTDVCPEPERGLLPGRTLAGKSSRSVSKSAQGRSWTCWSDCL